MNVVVSHVYDSTRVVPLHERNRKRGKPQHSHTTLPD